MTVERFQPISVKDPSTHPWRFKLRCLLDVQLATIARPLKPALKQLSGRVLDVGAGESPWRSWLPANTSYQGVDIENTDAFGMTPERPDVVSYDGRFLPFADASFDGALCIEVLEHAADPELLLGEISRVLTDEGQLLLTVPWSARRHHIPFDFHRFSRERLAELLHSAGFTDVSVEERGTDVGVIANKLLVVNLRWLRPQRSFTSLLAVVLGVLCLPATAGFLLLATMANRVDLGGREDPLGYFVCAVRSRRIVGESDVERD